MSYSWLIGSALDTGLKRRGSQNQDALGLVLPGFFNRRPPLLVIADGMGGYQGGEIASRLVVQTIKKVYCQTELQENPFEVIQKGILAAHQAIRTRGLRNQTLSSMGSTIVVAVLTQDKVYLANVGDSRAYLVNQEGIRLLSYDQSLVGEMVRQGIITPVEARTHPYRNRLNMSISVGRESLEIFTAVFDCKQDDVIVLCSDGLWSTVSEAQLQTVVLELPPQQAAEKLVALANTNQGPDNISVIVASETT
jgi:PPM family protein phosphatase